MTVPFFAKANGDWIRSTPAYDDGRLYVAGMKDVFIRRRQGLDPVTYVHPRMADFLGNTYGVMLFQVNRPSIKVCPPLVIDDEAIVEGIQALGDALSSLVS